MTMMVQKLLRLRGDEDWAAWGDRWESHVAVICELDFVTGWYGPPDWLRDRTPRQLDWGARLWELSKDELRHLIAPRPDYSDIRDDWDRPFREARQRQDLLLDSLPEEGRYGVVWMEIY